MPVARSEIQYGNATSSATFTGAVAIGDLIICIGNWATTGGSYGVTDNVNSGAYTQQQLIQNTTNGYGQFGVFSKVCDAAGVATVSLSPADSPQRLAIFHFSGFTGTPTFPAADKNAAQGSSNTALNSGSFNASVANEYAIAWFNDTGTNPPNPANSPFSSSLYGGYQLAAFDTTANFASGMPQGTATALAGTLGAADSWSAGVVGFYDAAVTAPTVTAVNGGSAIQEGASNVAVVGTGFASGMTAALAQSGGVSIAQPFTYSTSTSGTFNLTMEPGSGSQLAFTDATYGTNLTVTVSGNTSSNFAVTLAPPAGLIFETLTSINATSAYRITAVPDLVVGDQLEAAGNAAGTAAVPTGLQLNSDGTWQFANGDTPQNFYVRAYDSVNKVWGPYALQSTAPRFGRMMPGFLLGGLL